MIFKRVQDGRPYPDHGLSARDWANVAPRTIRLDELTTTKKELALDRLLDEDSTFYGDLFPTPSSGTARCSWRTGCTGPCAPRWRTATRSTCASWISTPCAARSALPE